MRFELPSGLRLSNFGATTEKAVVQVTPATTVREVGRCPGAIHCIFLFCACVRSDIAPCRLHQVLTLMEEPFDFVIPAVLIYCPTPATRVTMIETSTLAEYGVVGDHTLLLRHAHYYYEIQPTPMTSASVGTSWCCTLVLVTSTRAQRVRVVSAGCVCCDRQLPSLASQRLASMPSRRQWWTPSSTLHPPVCVRVCERTGIAVSLCGCCSAAVFGSFTSVPLPVSAFFVCVWGFTRVRVLVWFYAAFVTLPL